MACIKYEDRPWSKWFTKPPVGNAVRWFPRQGIELTPQLSAEIDRWFSSDEAQGLFKCRPEMSPNVEEANGIRMASAKDMGWIFFFSDPDTAFAFRLRFT